MTDSDGEGSPSVHDPPDERRFRMPPSFRLFAPVIVSFIAQVPFAIFVSVRSDLDTPVAILAVPIALVGPAALLAARRFPGPVAAIVTAATVADLFMPPFFGPPYIALAFAIIGGVVRGARYWVYFSLAAGWLVAVTLGSLVADPWHPIRIAGTTALLVLLVAFSEGFRVRRERMLRARRQAAERRRRAGQAERMRIAREVHDVVAHSLSQINVQAGMGLHLMDAQPERAREALAAIKGTSKQALDEIRAVLDVLRSEYQDQYQDRDQGRDAAPLAPQHDLSRIPDLFGALESHGVSVGYTSQIDDPVGAATQFALYRIAQESLTNVLRHAQATRVSVTIDQADDRVILTVRDNGRGANRGRSSGVVGAAGTGSMGTAPTGNGLLGMTERAELLGGTLDAGDDPTGGFFVRAQLPALTGERLRTDEP